MHENRISEKKEEKKPGGVSGKIKTKQNTEKQQQIHLDLLLYA